MPFLLGHPQLLFFEAVQEVPASTNTNNTNIIFLFKTFIGPVM
jgi:hypothetical protein